MNTSINKHALVFGLISTFLTGLGFTIITPVIPFMVQPYANAHNQAIIVTLLSSIYAVCTFFAAPGLGALSDRYGRKPVLLACLAGSALGYLIFGFAGALWVLFLGRIIDGLTGGNIVALFAYFADITEPSERTKVFGWTAAAVGIGSITGPTVGGLLAHFGNSTPFYFGAFICLANLIYGLLAMPESLSIDKRLKSLPISRLNPFTQLFEILTMKNLSRLLIAGFLLWIPSGALQAITGQFSLDIFNWRPVIIGLVFSIMGFQDIITQTFIMPRLLRRMNEQRLTILAIVSEILGYALIALSAFSHFWPIFIFAMFIYAFGDSVFGTAFNGRLSKSVSDSEQGKLQGGSQALQSLARIAGPLIGGQLYISLGHAAPAVMGVILLGIAILILRKKKA